MCPRKLNIHLKNIKAILRNINAAFTARFRKISIIKRNRFKKRNKLPLDLVNFMRLNGHQSVSKFISSSLN